MSTQPYSSNVEATGVRGPVPYAYQQTMVPVLLVGNAGDNFLFLPLPVPTVPFFTRIRRLSCLFVSPLSRRDRRDEYERERERES
jgi:hypothetical protein